MAAASAVRRTAPTQPAALIGAIPGLDLDDVLSMADMRVLDWLQAQGDVRAVHLAVLPSTLHDEGGTGRARVHAHLVAQLKARGADGERLRRGITVAVRGWRDDPHPGSIFAVGAVVAAALTDDVLAAAAFDDAAIDAAATDDAAAALFGYAGIVDAAILSLECGPCIDAFAYDWCMIASASIEAEEGSFTITDGVPSITGMLTLTRYDDQTAHVRVRLSLDRGPEQPPAIVIA